MFTKSYATLPICATIDFMPTALKVVKSAFNMQFVQAWPMPSCRISWPTYSELEYRSTEVVSMPKWCTVRCALFSNYRGIPVHYGPSINDMRTEDFFRHCAFITYLQCESTFRSQKKKKNPSNKMWEMCIVVQRIKGMEMAPRRKVTRTVTMAFNISRASAEFTAHEHTTRPRGIAGPNGLGKLRNCEVRNTTATVSRMEPYVRLRFPAISSHSP